MIHYFSEDDEEDSRNTCMHAKGTSHLDDEDDEPSNVYILPPDALSFVWNRVLTVPEGTRVDDHFTHLLHTESHPLVRRAAYILLSQLR